MGLNYIKDKGQVKIRINKIVFVMLLFTSIMYFAVLPFRNTALRHFIVMCGSILIYSVVAYRFVKTKYPVYQFVLIFAVIIEMLFSFLVGNNGGGIDLFKNCMDYFSLLILLSTSSNIETTEGDKRIMFYFAVICTIILVIVSQTSAAYLCEDGTNNGSLSLGMTNPNLTGMMITAIYGIILINLKQTTRKHFSVILLIVLLLMLFKTDARSAILATILLTVYSFFFSRKKISRAIVVVCVIFPVIAVPAYLYLYQILPSNFLFLGKPLFSGRQVLFGSIMESVHSLKEVLFGSMGTYRFANATNAVISVYLSLGLIGVMASYILYTIRLLNASKQAFDYTSRVALACILSFFIQSSAESFMLTGGFPGIVFIYLYTTLLPRTSNKVQQ